MTKRAPLVLAAVMAGTCVFAAGPASSNMCLVPGGPFRMGDHSGEGWRHERPAHVVHVSPFLIGRYEVSNAQMCDVLQWAYDHERLDANGKTVRNTAGRAEELVDLDDWNSELRFSAEIFSVLPGREDYPCVEVSWYGAAAYCNFRSEREGLEPAFNLADWSCDLNRDAYRLPTEAEWEKAARGGIEEHHFPWPSQGGTFDRHADGSMANYWGSGDPHDDGQPPVRTTPVGYYNGSQVPAGGVMTNGYGLFDMAGNVWEWCGDYYDKEWYKQRAAQTNDPSGPSEGTARIRRGGSWVNGQKEGEKGAEGGARAFFLRCASRAASDPANGRWNRGFRCVRPVRD